MLELDIMEILHMMFLSGVLYHIELEFGFANCTLCFIMFYLNGSLTLNTINTIYVAFFSTLDLDSVYLILIAIIQVIYSKLNLNYTQLNYLFHPVATFQLANVYNKYTLLFRFNLSVVRLSFVPQSNSVLVQIQILVSFGN
ncbi:Hypothetical_protein [Hexamita inflata]|uniref:Hypothetical_protein n=1 Tax=Hexamita inflata TaxID=28002 RepID=A0AA86NQ27_9EUKA|nr:Hypothetical protein HINF_LOCUS10808 [Hexamita inflata]CAI9923165.1 Hypothetical protein HINF_LOCUS10810 [Hexamita inflata]